MKVSVIIPSYNCAAYIGATLRSVMSQTERDIEIIVVDDSSTDDTLQIAAALAAKDPRIRVVSQQNSGTPSVGRNKAIRAARGEFVAFLDADDLYAPDKIEQELDALQRHPELGAVFADVALFQDDPVAEQSSALLRGLGFLEQAAASMEPIAGGLYRCKPSFYNYLSTRISAVNTQTVFVRRALLLQESTWFREDWRIGEDLDLWFRLARRIPFGYLDKVLAFYRQRPDSLTRDIEHAAIGFIRAHGTNLERGQDVLSVDEIQVIQSRLARQHMHLGYLYFAKGRMSEARASYRRAAELSPEHFSRTAFAKTWIPYPLVKLLHKVRGPVLTQETAAAHRAANTA